MLKLLLLLCFLIFLFFLFLKTYRHVALKSKNINDQAITNNKPLRTLKSDHNKKFHSNNNLSSTNIKIFNYNEQFLSG